MLPDGKTPDLEIECSQDYGELKQVLAAQILRSRSGIRVRALGTSMLPSIWPGDLLAIENSQPSAIRVGDIIRFMRAGRFVIHRVVRVANDCGNISWITRGDSLNCEDPAVSPRHLLGRVTAIHRNGRSFAPARQVSKLAHYIGRTLQSFDSLQGLVLRVRFILGRSRDRRAELAKAWR